MQAHFCPQCGTAVPEDSRFCPSCGTRLTSTPASPAAAAAQPPASPPPSPAFAPPPVVAQATGYPPAVAGVPGYPPAQVEFLVRGNGIGPTRLVIANGVLTAVVDAIPIALARTFRLAWAIGLPAWALVLLYLIGSARNNDARSVLSLLFFAGFLVPPIVYWTVIRPRHQVFTVVLPLTSIQEASTGTQSTAIGCLFLLLFWPGALLYLLVTDSRKAVIVKAPFMFGPDGVARLKLMCSSETEAMILLQALLRR